MPHSKIYKKVRYLVLLFACLASAVLYAGQHTTEALLDNGIKAYNSWQFLDAVKYLFAYEQRAPSALSNNVAFKEKFYQALHFSIDSIDSDLLDLKKCQGQILSSGGSIVSGHVRPPEFTSKDKPSKLPHQDQLEPFKQQSQTLRE